MSNNGEILIRSAPPVLNAQHQSLSDEAILKEGLGDSDSSTDLGLYVHVPFCRSRCHFCSFYIRVHRDDRVRRFLQDLDKEIQWYASHASLNRRSVSSIYLGGGTPTVLSPSQLCTVLERLRSAFTVCADAEITIEAEPDTLTAEYLDSLLRHGVTRISIGVQALGEDDRSRLGRKDTMQGIERVIALTSKVGFRNLNVDLMYGIPGQTLDGWMATLSFVMQTEPAHVSCYACTIEPNSRFGVDVRRGEIQECEAALQNEMEEAAEALLTEAGYERYELSNYARPGYRCRHNLRYWTDREYVGLGPSAQSYVASIRFGNLADLHAYGEQLKRGRLPLECVERLPADQRARERVVFGLRLLAGVDVSDIESAIHDHDWHRTVEDLIDDGWLQRVGPRLRLTEHGRRFADSVAVALWI
ncbi:MAG: radical SAM family heme chaperone HemW [Nitrospirae bacterium]|nr:MAG: radical SAM family heme chaperone HemW [Nitrospirota bacterium]